MLIIVKKTMSQSQYIQKRLFKTLNFDITMFDLTIYLFLLCITTDRIKNICNYKIQVIKLFLYVIILLKYQRRGALECLVR